MSIPISIPSFGGDATVGAVSTGYPFQPRVDVTNVLGASDGVDANTQVKLGSFSITGTATGTATDVITFPTAFPAATDGVLLTLTSLGGAVINGGAVGTAISAAGVTVSVDITTAGTTDVTGTWLALGH